MKNVAKNGELKPKPRRTQAPAPVYTLINNTNNMYKFVIVYQQGIYKRYLPINAENKKQAKDLFYKKIDTCIILEINKMRKL